MHQDVFFQKPPASDEELVSRAKAQDSTALAQLITKHLDSVKALARGFRAAGLEQEDLTQEALVGFVKAVRSYDIGRGIPFAPYASLCMRRHLLSTVKSAGAGKHKPLSNYIPLDDDSGIPLYRSDDSRTVSPESIVIRDEEATDRTQQIQSLLSVFEQDTLNLYLAGLSHVEMAKRLRSTPKSVDNALQRVRRKLRSMKL